MRLLRSVIASDLIELSGIVVDRRGKMTPRIASVDNVTESGPGRHEVARSKRMNRNIALAAGRRRWRPWISFKGQRAMRLLSQRS